LNGPVNAASGPRPGGAGRRVLTAVRLDTSSKLKPLGSERAASKGMSFTIPPTIDHIATGNADGAARYMRTLGSASLSTRAAVLSPLLLRSEPAAGVIHRPRLRAVVT